MNKKIMSLLVLIILSFSSQAFSQSIFYIKGALGPSSQKDNSFGGANVDYNLSGIGATSLIFGLNIGPQMSTEIEFSGRKANIDSIDGSAWDGDLDSSSILFNGLYKYPFSNGFSFVAGLGFGVLSAEIYDAVADDFADGSSFAAQFIIGGEASITEQLDFTFEYKKLSTVDLELSGPTIYKENMSYHSGALMVGLKYNF